MKVILKSDLFTPFGRFKRTENSRFPSELPDEVRPHVPRTAIVIEDEPSGLPIPKRGVTAPEEDAPEPVTITEVAKLGKGVTALEHYSKKK